MLWVLEVGVPLRWHFTPCFVKADIARDMALNPLDEFDAFARAWSDVHGFHRQTLRQLDDIR